MRKLVVGLVVVLMVGAIVMQQYLPKKETEHVHYHAGFIVYVDGIKQDYSDYKYMNFKPCTEEATKQTKEDEQIEKAHLHDGVGDVVHVEQGGSVWGDLFSNIGVTFPTDKPLTGYINGERVEDILQQPITGYSTALLVVGNGDEVDIKQLVPIEHIKEVEAKSELCGSD